MGSCLVNKVHFSATAGNLDGAPVLSRKLHVALASEAVLDPSLLHPASFCNLCCDRWRRVQNSGLWI